MAKRKFRMFFSSGLSSEPIRALWIPPAWRAAAKKQAVKMAIRASSTLGTGSLTGTSTGRAKMKK